MIQPDRRVVQVNIRDATKTAVAGARAYLVSSWTGGASERVELLIRSRGGRWIRKWEPAKRLVNPRVVTLPKDHPLYDRDLWDYRPEEYAADLAAAIERAS